MGMGFKHRMLMDLVERKLGPGATIRVTQNEWVAERVANGKRHRVAAKTRDILEWLLKELPDLEAA